MSDENRPLHVAVELKGNLLKKAIEIKERLGLTTWAEVLRYLVAEYHREKIQNER